jgi:small GTP-binding protein
MKTSQFIDPRVTTAGADYLTCSVPIDGTEVQLVIWDTAGEEKFRSVMPMYFRNVAAVVIAYSIADLPTFNEVDTWRAIVGKEVKSDAVPIFLVGTKEDLSKQRQVPSETGENKAAEIGAAFFETSAVNGANVPELLEAMARQVMANAEALRTVFSVDIETATPQTTGQRCC